MDESRVEELRKLFPDLEFELLSSEEFEKAAAAADEVDPHVYFPDRPESLQQLRQVLGDAEASDDSASPTESQVGVPATEVEYVMYDDEDGVVVGDAETRGVEARKRLQRMIERGQLPGDDVMREALPDMDDAGRKRLLKEIGSAVLSLSAPGAVPGQGRGSAVAAAEGAEEDQSNSTAAATAAAAAAAVAGEGSAALGAEYEYEYVDSSEWSAWSESSGGSESSESSESSDDDEVHSGYELVHDESGADAESEGAEAAAGTLPPRSFRGVVQREDGSFHVDATVDGVSIQQGPFASAAKAAETFDAVARALGAPESELNFPRGGGAGGALTEHWQPPTSAPLPQHIPVVRNQPLSVEEVVAAIEAEGGMDVEAIDLRGHSPLCEHMVFATGHSRAHMQRMADMVVEACRARRLKKRGGFSVEDRDSDDWIAVDTLNLVVSFFSPVARRTYNFEEGWRAVARGEDPNAGVEDEDEWLERNPIPEDHPPLLEQQAHDASARRRGIATTTVEEERRRRKGK